MNIKILELAYHRNGVAGNGFYVVIFKCPKENGTSRMMGTLFREPGNCAVLNLELMPDVTFGVNSWRGDHYESALRAAIETRQGVSLF